MGLKVRGEYELIVLGFDKSKSDLEGRLYSEMGGFKVYFNKPSQVVRSGDKVLARITDSSPEYLLADVVRNLGCSVKIRQVYNVKVTGQDPFDARNSVSLPSHRDGINGILTIITRGGLLKKGQWCKIVVKYEGLDKKSNRYYLRTNLAHRSLELDPNKTIFYAQWQKALDPTLEEIVSNYRGVPKKLGLALYFRSEDEFRMVYSGWIKRLSEDEPASAIKKFMTEYKYRESRVRYGKFMLAIENTKVEGLVQEGVEELNRDKNLELKLVELKRRG